MISSRVRGQTLPLWVAAILSSLVLMYFAINYGNVLRWQIRVQNDADSAASAIVSMQTESWNQMNAVLYASDVEELRIRKQIDNLYNIIHLSGGCKQEQIATGSNSYNCAAAWNVLRNYLSAAASRYTTDVTVLQSVTQNADFTHISADAVKLMAKLNRTSACMDSANPTGTLPDQGDCKAYYTLLNLQKRSGLLEASEDTSHLNLPRTGFSVTAINPTGCSGGASPDYNECLFGPLEAEIAVCAPVPPIIPNFFFMTAPTYTAAARAAATAVMVEQDWLEPSAYTRPYDPLHPAFQSDENYESNGGGFNAGNNADGNEASYHFNYGGLTYGAYSAQIGFATNGTPGSDFEAEMGWWAPIPIAPFSGAKTATGGAPNGLGCDSGRSG